MMMNELMVIQNIWIIRHRLLAGVDVSIVAAELGDLAMGMERGVGGTPITARDWESAFEYLATGHLDPPIQHFEMTFGVGTYTDLLWDIYQSTGRYEDMTGWLKHAAWERLEGERLRGVIEEKGFRNIKCNRHGVHGCYQCTCLQDPVVGDVA